jgi:mRNA interferase RelE/StbE
MRYEIILAPEAVVDLNQFEPKLRRKVKEGIGRYLRHEPKKISKSRIKRLRGLSRPQYRLRIDEVRVFYDVVEKNVEVLGIVEKSRAAEWLERHGEK